MNEEKLIFKQTENPKGRLKYIHNIIRHDTFSKNLKLPEIVKIGPLVDTFNENVKKPWKARLINFTLKILQGL